LQHQLKSEHGAEWLSHRCLICGTPLHGPTGYLARLFGITRSHRNPNLCNRCNTHVEEGRLSEITVLFADLSGFTKLTHELGADGAFEVVNAFLQMSTFELVKRGAFIDKYIGDAVMAIFNVPLRVSDHQARAVEAALEILDQTEKLGVRLGRTLAAGAGIASGWARMGSLGSADERDFTAIGEVVNLASCLEEKTGAGEILVDAGVYQQVALDFSDMIPEALSLKGLGDSIPAYRLRRTSGMRQHPALRPSDIHPGAKRSFAFGALIVSVLGAPCAATTLIGPLADALGFGSVFGATSTLWFLDDWRVRLPLMAGALLVTFANLYTLWRSSHQGKHTGQGGGLPVLSRSERRRAYMVCGSAVFTFFIVAFELYTHHFIMHHPWP